MKVLYLLCKLREGRGLYRCFLGLPSAGKVSGRDQLRNHSAPGINHKWINAQEFSATIEIQMDEIWLFPVDNIC